MKYIIAKADNAASELFPPMNDADALKEGKPDNNPTSAVLPNHKQLNQLKRNTYLFLISQKLLGKLKLFIL